MDKETGQVDTPNLLSRIGAASKKAALPLGLLTALASYTDRAHAETLVVDSNGNTWSCDNDIDDLDGDGTPETSYNTRGNVYAFSGKPGEESSVAVMDGSILDTEFSTDGNSFSSLRSQVAAFDSNATSSSIAMTGYAPSKDQATLRVALSSFYLVDNFRSGSPTLTDLSTDYVGSYGSVDDTSDRVAAYGSNGTDGDVQDAMDGGATIYGDTGNQSNPVIDDQGDRVGMLESGNFHLVSNLSLTADKDLMVTGAAPVQYLSADNAPSEVGHDMFVYITTPAHASPYQAFYCANLDSAPTPTAIDTDGDGVDDEDDECPTDPDPTCTLEEDTGAPDDTGDTGDTGTPDDTGDSGEDTDEPADTAEDTGEPVDSGEEECPEVAQAAPADLCGVEGGSADAIDGAVSVDEEGTIILDGVPDAISVESDEGGSVSVEISLDGQAIIPATVYGVADIVLGFEDGTSEMAPMAPPDADGPTVRNVYAKLVVGEGSSVELNGVPYGPGTHHVLVGTETTTEAPDTGGDDTGDTGDTDPQIIDTDDSARPDDTAVEDTDEPKEEDPVQRETPPDEGGCSTGSTGIPGGLAVGVAFGAVLANRRRREQEQSAQNAFLVEPTNNERI